TNSSHIITPPCLSNSGNIRSFYNPNPLPAATIKWSQNRTNSVRPGQNPAFVRMHSQLQRPLDCTNEALTDSPIRLA
ncbi:MAG: hypothetical protein QHJ82_05375, partial [Verrucomicrobiota bacterium]|nr:hypothetical protein [Verrucomicrobiota bacterium]